MKLRKKSTIDQIRKLASSNPYELSFKQENCHKIRNTNIKRTTTPTSSNFYQSFGTITYPTLSPFALGGRGLKVDKACPTCQKGNN